MTRITRDEVLMEMAIAASKRSTCMRKHVGALLAMDSRPLMSGYAGSPSGQEHCNDDNCFPDKPCTRTIHAEANAIYWAARKGVATEGATLYCTCSPCKVCAEAIISAGIKRAVFKERYRDQQGLNMLSEAGIEIMILP